jgi:hypothetical protein
VREHHPWIEKDAVLDIADEGIVGLNPTGPSPRQP